MESDKHPVYRFCIVPAPLDFQIMDYKSKWAGEQIRDEFPETTGPLSYLVDSTLSLLFKSLRANISLNVENEFGTQKKDGTMTGCYRKIRDNESDFSIALHNFPTIDYDKVDPYQILMQDSVKIMSAYHSQTKPEVSLNDFILTWINSFDDQTWFAVLVMVSVLFGIWMIRRVLFPDNEDVFLRKGIAETLWDTLLLLISQDSTNYDKFMDRLLSILLTLLFCLLSSIYFSFMSTGLVSVVKPAVINSYEDIMNRPNMIPVFFSMSDTQEFEDAYEDHNYSIQAKFWAKYKDKVEIAGCNTRPAERIQMEKGINLNRVHIMNGAFIDEVRKFMCRLKIGYQVHENIYTWISRDSAARMQMKGFILRNGMKQTRDLKAFRRKVRSAFETGIFYIVINALVKNGLEFKFPHSQVERCLSDEVVYANASLDTVVLQNYDLLFSFLVYMLPAEIIVLLIELVCKQYH